jgi:hypothetical protein
LVIGDVPLRLLPDPVVDLTLVEKRNEYSVELLVIIVALQWVEDVQPVRIIGRSDSLSVLNSLSSGKSDRSDLLNHFFIFFIFFISPLFNQVG